MQFKTISFFAECNTSNGYYSNHAKRFIQNCKDLNLDYFVDELKGYGEYYKNTRMKPAFILDCLHKFSCPVLWLDIDTIIQSHPTIDKSADIMMVKCRQRSFLGYVHALYFPYEPKIINFVEEWKNKCDSIEGERGDHTLFDELIKKSDIKYSFFDDFCTYKLAPKSVGKK